MAYLSATNLPLAKVFSTDFVFTIPRYQRPYAWETEHALQLLEDLTDALVRGDEEPYFLGSIVLVKPDANKPEANVIDGQQRLTTLTILLAVLRDLASDPDIAKDVRAMISDEKKSFYRSGAVSRPRLTPRPQDAEFFRKHIQEQGSTARLSTLTDAVADTDPRRAVRDNGKALFAALAERSDEERSALLGLLDGHTELVVVTTPNEASAHRIFGVMNARGLELSPTDIFKSTVIGNLSSAKEDAYADRWDAAEDAVGRENFADLFRDIRFALTGERARVELMKEFPKQVLDDYVESGRAAEFVDDVLDKYATAFTRTLTPYFGPAQEWHQVNRWLSWLEQVDNKDWRPLALWALVERPDDPAFLGHFLEKLERLAASLMIRGTNTTDRLQRYTDLLKRLKAAEDQLAVPELELSEEEKCATRERLSGPVYQTFQSRRLRYVLTRLDALLANGPGVAYTHSIVSVEHVLPQNPEDDSHWRESFDDDAREHWTHRLGNLLLLSKRKNSEANRRDFADKKRTYYSSSSGTVTFALTSQVLTVSDWTISVVQSRQEQLTKRLAAEWDLGSAVDDTVAPERDRSCPSDSVT
ncbi:MAG: DUF262 domain-containing protein [Salana multivorans]|uniref:DUF262 domain-containing protein n=1 Tax=Salana multivorans TaxID=120377 RepID=UPI000963E947|nr:DUF262 domain-containing protein [Salana multivorans]MBN8881949.1 DUF262 domain-containing protein [Salana multivorans]OJX97354.1 MAG: hypothetical protein BGO96_05320 [Micrococcales bacterium 73-15]